MGRLELLASALAVLLSVMLAFGALGCGGNESEPERTVRQMFDALEGNDLEKAESYMTGAMEQPQWLLDQQQAMIDNVDIDNLKLEVIPEEKDEVTLKADYDIELTLWTGFVYQHHNTQTVSVVRIDDRWLVSHVVGADR